MAKPLGFKDFVSVDYTQDGDDQVAYNAKKRKKHDEALDMTQRLARKRSFKKNKAKIALGRKRAAKRTATMDVLKKRAQKQARTLVMKKLTKGIPKDELSLPRRQEIEKRLDKMKPKIDKIAKRLIPQVRKKEMERKKGPKEDD